jgi:indolepyruvate ferredoxin oxidoreductase
MEKPAMLEDVKLDDKYDLSKSTVFLSGTQAVVRLTMMQKARDKAAGLNTAGYVTGYRGSPVGALDQQFARAKVFTDAYDVKFEPGVNEDLAATALWGSQQVAMRGEGKFQGVFGIWYGKGPGVDRTGDVFRHANSAGTAEFGGVLALTGDDHAAESSTVPHQSEFALMDAMMPILHPAGVQEILDFGVLGIAMSRFCGCWVGLKAVHDNIESTAIVDGSIDRIKVNYPKDFVMPEGGLNIRSGDDRFEQEERLHTHKRFAAAAFARVNGLDKIVIDSGRKARIGIVSTGKSYLDVCQALEDLGIDDATAEKLGVRFLKVGMVWPLDPQIVAEFARGLEQIIVVEEKRSLIETQIREQLYDLKNRPAVIGKKDEAGEHMFRAFRTLEPNAIAIVLAERLLKKRKNKNVSQRLENIRRAQARVSNTSNMAERVPYFCSGCPHNSSTKVPEGGRAYAGIGCHWMAQMVPGRRTDGATHMGGEGANWIGEAPFSIRNHVFQNIGDGTYNHSGILAIRAAVASGVNITYKVLYNDAVAMTGGQPHEGNLSVPQIASQVRAEGVERIVVVSDEPDKYPAHAGFPVGVSFHHRDDLDEIQRELMEVKGTSVLIYDQTCAAEKRRRRKRGTFPDPAKRVFINEAVCEGCGDCGVQSNCVAIAAVETRFGRKRQIDQNMCNKDYSCVNGFCPSFVTVHGGEIRKPEKLQQAGDGVVFEVLPDARLPDISERPWSMIITGIGGTGVVTIGQLLGMAARLEGKGTGIIDMAGLAQKNGAVVTHMKIAARPEDISTIRIAAGGADMMLGCDLVTSASDRNLSRLSQGRSHAVINSHEVMPAQFTHHADFLLPGETMAMQLQARMDADKVHFADMTRIAKTLLGDSIAANLFTLGFAWQKGLVPVGRQAIEKAVELNGVAVEMNQQAFLWGRRAAHDLARVEKIIGKSAAKQPVTETLDEMVNTRAAFLKDYQNEAYAQEYRVFVNSVRRAEADLGNKDKPLSKAVARYLFKLMAYKDEYEVARLFSDGCFMKSLDENFTGDYSLKFHLAPPVFAKTDPQTGHLRKKTYGPGMMKMFRFLARLKGLRGGIFDVFGYRKERKAERAAIGDYRRTIDGLLETLTKHNVGLAAEIASLPEHIRGYGHVKEQHIGDVQARGKVLQEAYNAGRTRAPQQMAAE